MRTQGNRNIALKEALFSLQGQQWPISALVVAHCGEEKLEGIKRTIAEFDQKSLRIDLLNETDIMKKRGAPLNLALKHVISSATGNFKYLSFLDDDDIFYPNFSTAIVNRFEIDQDADFVYAVALEKKESTLTAQYTNRSPLELTKENICPINSFAIKFDSFRKNPVFFDESLDYLEDWDFLFELFKSGYSFRRTGSVVSEYRVRSDGSYSLEGDRALWRSSEETVRRKIASSLLSLKGSDINLYLNYLPEAANREVPGLLRKRHRLAIRLVDKVSRILSI